LKDLECWFCKSVDTKNDDSDSVNIFDDESNNSRPQYFDR